MKTILDLFLQFLQVGLFSIGGGYATLPLIQQRIVETERWLSSQAFSDIVTISQMTPGPLAVNASTFVGLRIGGIAGAVTATVGCILPGFCLSLLLYHLFRRYQNLAGVTDILKGLKAAAAGLIAAAAAGLLCSALAGSTRIAGCVLPCSLPAAGIFLIVLLLVRKTKLNPILLILLCGAAGLLLYEIL